MGERGRILLTKSIILGIFLASPAGPVIAASLFPHSGYDTCIELANKTMRVPLCPACGGRMLDYSPNGWNDLMSVRRFPTYPDRVCDEVAALTISIWYFKDLMCGLEPIGPMETIPPGQSASFTETWWLLPYTFPRDRTRLDTGRIADALRKELAQDEGERR